MSSVTKRHTGHLKLATSSDPLRADDAAVARNKIKTMKQKLRELQRELESITLVPTPAIERGLDFYTEVSLFEVELLKSALRVTEGHQLKAAQLLNLNKSTLSAMIKRYHVQLAPFLIEPSQRTNETRLLMYDD